MPSASAKKITDISEWKNAHRNIHLVEDVVNAVDIKMQYQINEGNNVLNLKKQQSYLTNNIKKKK